MRARTCGPSGEFHVYEHPPAEHLRSPQIHLHRQFKAAQPLVTLRRLLPSGFFRSSCCARRRNQWQRGSTGQRRPRSGSSKKEPAPSEEEQNRKDHCDDEKNVHDRYLPFSLKCSTMAPPPGLARRVHCNPGLPAPDDRAWATARLGNVTGDPGVRAGVVPHFVLRYRIMLTLQLFTRWRELHRGSEQQPSQVVCPPWWGLLWPLAGRFYPGPVP